MEMIIIWILMGIICAIIAQQKKRNAIGWFFLGAGFAIISLIVLLFLPTLEETMPCPFCKEPIKKDATICKHCNSVFKK